MAEVSNLQLHENDDDLVLFDRENQVNFIIEMFHQSVEQSQLQSHSASPLTDLHNHDQGSQQWNHRTESNNLELDFGFGLGFHVHNLGSDFDRNHYNANEDLELEEIDDHDILNMIFESEPDNDDTREFEEQLWEVILTANNNEPNPNLTYYNDILFAQFPENDTSSLGQPPASVKAVENLLSVVITDEDVKNNNTVCTVCKDEIIVGLIAKKLPCGHLYHGDCIIPWLEIRNTCPVCRHELLTDDLEYERKKEERVVRD